MAKEIEVLLPKMGESVAEATVIKWLKEEGDFVEADEPIIEIATDKVDSEVPAPGSGILSKQLCGEGDVVQVGAAIALMTSEAASGETDSPAPKASTATAQKPVQSANGSAPAQAVSTGSEQSELISRSGKSGRFYSPLVRNIAVAEGIAMEELELISGTGNEGRVTKKDILAYLPERNKSGAATQPSKATPESKTAEKILNTPPIGVNAGDEIIEMDRMRKLISEHMVMSKRVSPHVTSFIEADVTNMVRWRNKIKEEYKNREGENITFTPLFIEAIVRAIKDF